MNTVLKTQVFNNEHQTDANKNNLFPVFLKLDTLRLLIVGGGAVGCEKLKAVIHNTQRRHVRVIGEKVSDEVLKLAAHTEGIIVYEKRYDSSDLENIDVVFCAVDDAAISQDIRRDAKARNLLVNVADKPNECDFYLGSIVQKGHLKIAISTNGKSPTLAKRLKEILIEGIPDEFDDLLESFYTLRQKLNGNFAEKVRRLNIITQDLISETTEPVRRSELFWKKVAYTCITALAFLFIGNALARFITIEQIAYKLVTISKAVPRDFYLMLATGFLAQMVDGALGMGYGVTCTSVLLAIGIPIPQISGGIHTAEMFSSGASGFSHYKFGNVNRKLLKIILIPAITGAFAGAFILCRLGQEYAGYLKPILAFYTMFLGIRILFNAFRKKQAKSKMKNVGWLGFCGGFLDSVGGGGWGPLVTSTLISKGKSPKYVIGTVSLAEFFVTLVSALTFFLMIGVSHWQVVTGLIIGGLFAAPFAAKLSGKLSKKTGFLAIGTLIIIWSLNIILRIL